MAGSNLTLEHIDKQEIDKMMAPIVYLSVLMVIGIPGNITVLLIYLKRYSRSVYRTIILSLGFTDLFFCIVALPFNIVRIVCYYTFYSVWACKSFTTLIGLNAYFSAHLILILSVHRFRQVCMSLKSQMNPTNIRYWIAGGFIFGVLFDVPDIILQPVDKVFLGHNMTGFVCAVSFKTSAFAEVYNGFSTFLFGSYTITLFLIYLMIGRRLYIQRKCKSDVLYQEEKDELSSKITKIAITVSVVFAISYIPIFVLKLLVDVINQERLNSAMFSFLKIVERSYAINHVANPFIYAVFDSRFRFHFRSLVSNLRHFRTHDKTCSRNQRPHSAHKTIDSSLFTL